MGNRLWVIGCAFVLASCSSLQLSVDDAYHWEEKMKGASRACSPSQPSLPSTPSTPSEPIEVKSEPVLEFVNVQDTTVTVRIKR